MSDKMYPNRVRALFSTNSTDWNMLGVKNNDGVAYGYATYAALLADGAQAFPGSVADFPRGVPRVLFRSDNGAGAAGSAFFVKTNTINAPSGENADDLVGGYDQTLIYEDEAVRAVWLKKTVGGDNVFVSGAF